ncbi:MAG TPA: RND transporter [Gammaproteobacteria bacterium]|nr:RND transporter [Gammaproteobacteria bacterium]
MNWLRNLPVMPLALPAILLALAPFVPKPHLVEKLGMLFQGNLTRPIDIFDLLMHGTLITLLIIKLLFLKPAEQASSGE